MTRRVFAGASAAALLAAAPTKTKMGVCTTCYLTAGRPKDQFEFLEHCNSIGAGGIQSPVTNHDPAYLKKVRAKADEYGMFIETMGSLPNAREPEAFGKLIESSKALGAGGLRSACLGGRRYETFGELAAWKKFVADSEAAVAKASKMAEAAKFPVTIENHKDWTADEMVALMKRYGNDYFGVCLDTGNNISLLDDPYEPIEKLAPYALSTHIKDMGLGLYKDGFLLSEVIFGNGILDIPRVVKTIRAAKPKTRMILEMITRSPLRVPVYNDKYWLTLNDARTPQRLANALRNARDFQPKVPLPVIEGMSVEAVKTWEIENVKACLAYSAQHLDALQLP